MRDENPGIVRFSLSTNASATLGLSSKQIPLLLVGASIGPAAAGAFRLATQLAQALAKLSQMLSRAAFPEIVRAVRTAEPSRLRRILIADDAGEHGGRARHPRHRRAGRRADPEAGRRQVVRRRAIRCCCGSPPPGCFDLATVSLDTVMTALHRAGTVFAIRAVGVAAAVRRGVRADADL